jgi:hypothetical protein
MVWDHAEEMASMRFVDHVRADEKDTGCDPAGVS